jgi:hypothetical protein
MVLYLIILLAVVAITIAIAPVLAMSFVECRSEARAKEARAKEARALATAPTRIPWNLGGPEPTDVPAVRRRPARVG